MTKSKLITRKMKAISILAKREGKKYFEKFVRLFPPAKDYKWGNHTKRICAELQRAYDRYRQGKSTYLIINVPPRFGKSDLVSRRFGPWLFANDRDIEVILASYSSDLAKSMSRDARRCCYEHCVKHYGAEMSRDRDQVASWGFENGKGGFKAVGFGSSVTGSGSSALLIDDYLKNRQEAESALIRDRQWDSFRNDLMTRLAPVHIVVILATRWHNDDLIGRIEKESEANEDFPKFRKIVFKAYDETKKEYAFPERFDVEFFKRMKATLGIYAWESLYQQSPTVRGGNMLKAYNVEIVDRLPKGDDGKIKHLKYCRGWDLASTEKQRTKQDPDYTVGVKCGYDEEEDVFYICDVRRGQWGATERNHIIYMAAKGDGPMCDVKIEGVAGYRDTWEILSKRLSGHANVELVKPSGDKVSRASILEPLFDSGTRIKIVRAEWLDALQAELAAFPSGEHDDQVDALVMALWDWVVGAVDEWVA